jgi:hypothetical protein
MVLLLSGVAIVVGGGYWYLRPRGPKEEVYYHFLCPNCGRKLKYKARKAGQPGVCPRCKKGCTFPHSGVDRIKEHEPEWSERQHRQPGGQGR